MSERGFRGARGSRGEGRGHRGGRGGGRGGSYEPSERPKRENILDLNKYMNKRIALKLNGGREIHGELVGYDQLMNMVLDDVVEVGEMDEEGERGKREIGLAIIRGTMLMTLSPLDGGQTVDNPMFQGDEEDDE